MISSIIKRITGKNYIGNNTSSQSRITFKTFNPQKNKENEYVFYEASNNEINEAVSLATKAFESYKLLSGKRKAEFLNTIAEEIILLDDLLLQTYCLESGLSLDRAKKERSRTIFQLHSFANLISNDAWLEPSIDTAIPDRKPVPKPDIRRMNVPIGPVVVFGASNFPLAYSTAGGDTASALASGCPVIVKSHPMHAATGELVAAAIIRAAQKTKMPNGVFSNLNSSGIEVGQQLVLHPDVKAVGFTGSIKGGRAIHDLISKRTSPIPFFAEMGSINPVVVFPSILEKRGKEFAQKYAKSITEASGQFCTNPGLIMGIESENFSKFIDTLSKELIKIPPSCMLHPKIMDSYKEAKATIIKQHNVQVITAYPNKVKPNYVKQSLATVSGKYFIETPELQQEVFGPFSLIVKCKNKEELERAICNIDGQLTATALGNILDLNEFKNLISQLSNKVGRIIFNGVPTGVEVCNSMVHGGPYPSSTDARFSAVGESAIKRWVRPFSYQNWPNELLPEVLKNENTLGILRFVNNKLTTDKIQ